ncbi:MAG: RnfABCDGE type electron transport complex subunit G [Treponema sp.]|jgi:electron transport complex protein RnfG|nr:RnfABCDGE type electron transport complex subunit G [Treponema sp.]
MKIGNMLKLGLILALFAAAACVMLAFVYTGTANIISQRQQADLEAALREIFPDADRFEAADGIKSPDAAVSIENAYMAIRNGEPAGAALQLTRASYGGPIKIMAGVSVNGTITGVKIMEHSDTPGLGANAASPQYFVDKAKRITFLGQFTGKSVDDPFEVKGDVAAITASTVTSRAVASTVKAAGIAVTAWFAGLDVDAVSAATEEGLSSSGGVK